MDEHFEHSADFELLGRFATGEASPEEAARAQEWIADSDENRRTWEAVQAAWNFAPDPDKREKVQVDAAWERVSAAAGLVGQAPETAAAPRRQNWNWLRIAAMLVVAVGLSLTAWYFVGNDKVQAIQQLALVAGDEVLQDTLPDGTVVTLNAGASLAYPSAFTLAQREVKLEGEAFFEVTRNVKQPFVIHAGTADVRVLGTSFNVRSTQEEVTVVVATGKVELSAPEDQRVDAVILEPGHAGNYRAGSGTLQKTVDADRNLLFWKDRRLVYRSRALVEVAQELEALFDVQIELDAATHGKCMLNTEFKNQSIESILNIIAETFNLEMTQDENTFTYRGPGCN